MLEIISLFTRFVTAVESIAASLAVLLAKPAAPVTETETPTAKTERKVEPTVNAEQVEEAPVKTRRTRTTKAKEEPEIDVKALRAEVLEIDDALTDGDIEEALDEFDDLMDEYSAKTLKDIKEADLPEFVKKARKIVAKYYDEK